MSGDKNYANYRSEVTKLLFQFSADVSHTNPAEFGMFCWFIPVLLPVTIITTAVIGNYYGNWQLLLLLMILNI